MAKLHAVVEKLDDVPEGLRELYVEADGKYRLDADGVDALVDTSGLKNALAAERKAAKDARDALKRWDGKDPAKYDELLSAAEAAEAQKLQTEGKWEEMKDRLTKAHQKVLDDKDAEIKKRDTVIENLTVRNELDAAIDKAGVQQKHRKAVRALLRDEARPSVKWEGDVPHGVMGDVAIAEYVESWSKTDEAAEYLEPTGAGGSGAKGGGSGGGGARKPFREMTEADKIAFVNKHGKDEFLKHMMATK